MIYIADTHTLLWFLSEDSELSIKGKEIFEHVENGEGIIIIPTIVLAELMALCEKKSCKEIYAKIVEKIEQGENYNAYDLDLKVVKVAETLTRLRDIHDRIIAATAQILKAPIITRDRIIEQNNVDVIW